MRMLAQKFSYRFLSLAALLILPAAAPAQSTRAQLLDQLSACRKVAEPEARLACFDKASAQLEAAVNAKTVVVLDQEDVRKTRRSLFGFALPKLPFFGSDKDEEPEEEIVTTIASARALPYGKWSIKLEDGAIWHTLETTSNVIEPRAGLKVEIRKAAIGSYFLKVAGQRGIRARRFS